MVYPDYVKIKSRFYSLQRKFEELLLSKEKIFTDCLPSGIRYDKDIVQSTPSDPMERYITDLEQVEKNISQTREALSDWETLLKLKERELRESKAIHDRVYVMRYLDQMSVMRISGILNYSRRQTYRIIGRIEKMSHYVTDSVLK